MGHPLTVYGKGGQTRGFLDIRDTVRCIQVRKGTEVQFVGWVIVCVVLGAKGGQPRWTIVTPCAASRCAAH